MSTTLPERFARDPIEWVEHLLQAAQQATPLGSGVDPMRCALATASANGRPSVRYVLLKSFDAKGFVFYTNYGSRKAAELSANPFAALAFHWWNTEVQIRAEGPTEMVSIETSDAYFATRERESQLGAWASPQSRPIDDRSELEHRLAAARARFEHGPVPRPDHWGGYRLTPHAIEIWCNGEHRLHDRFRFVRETDGWSSSRLAP